MAEAVRIDAIVIGAGMSGLLAAIKLGQAGLSRVVLEKSGDVGGTWLDNVYPGSGCDVPAHLYSYSFAPKPNWSRLYARQPELLDYFRGVADTHGLREALELNTEASAATFDEARGEWTVTADEGRSWTARFLFIATGQLNQPAYAAIPGRNDFAGAQFHSARWDASVALAGRRVGVIGNGASAVQFVPEIAPEAAHLTVFQRSPNWIIPRSDEAISELRHRLYRHVPGWRLMFRGLIYQKLEANWAAISQPRGKHSLKMEKEARDHLAAQVPDPALRAMLTPDYPVGCKRLLVSDDYYPALMRDTVSVEARAIAAIEPGGVALADGSRVALDVLIWATGFQSHQFVAPLAVYGLGGRSLADEWAGGPRAYRSVTVSGFPNLFLLYGPNSNLGHNSIIFMVEQQVGYAMRAIARVRRGGGKWLDVKAEAQAAFNLQLQRELATTAWAAGCGSWYLREGGDNASNYPGSTRRFAREMKRLDEEAYDFA